MSRPCSICTRPDRAAIDADLSGGLGLTQVASRYGVGRSALQRHRTDHLGRAVTFHIPPSNPAVASTLPAPAALYPPSPEASPQVPAAVTLDSSAALDRLFARATAGKDRSLQDWLRLTLDGLGHTYAKADAIGDLSVATRALRELRALLQLHANVEPAKLRIHAGWQEPPPLRDPIFTMLGVALAETPEDIAQAEAEHRAAVADWRERGLSGYEGSLGIRMPVAADLAPRTALDPLDPGPTVEPPDTLPPPSLPTK